MRAAGIANNAEQLQNNREELELAASVLQEHEQSIADQLARYEEQGLLLASVSKELKQQQANYVSYQRVSFAPSYRPPTMRNQHNRTTADSSNYQQPYRTGLIAGKSDYQVPASTDGNAQATRRQRSCDEQAEAATRTRQKQPAHSHQ